MKCEPSQYTVKTIAFSLFSPSWVKFCFYFFLVDVKADSFSSGIFQGILNLLILYRHFLKTFWCIGNTLLGWTRIILRSVRAMKMSYKPYYLDKVTPKTFLFVVSWHMCRQNTYWENKVLISFTSSCKIVIHFWNAFFIKWEKLAFCTIFSLKRIF